MRQLVHGEGNDTPEMVSESGSFGREERGKKGRAPKYFQNDLDCTFLVIGCRMEAWWMRVANVY